MKMNIYISKGTIDSISTNEISNVFENLAFDESTDSQEEEELSCLELLLDKDGKSAKESLVDPGSGEICAKYIPMSRSSLIRHPYYNYPSIKNPGIVKALLEPASTRFRDGKDHYLDICKEMKTTPVNSFIQDMTGKAVNLTYYGVTSNGLHAMCLILRYNYSVRRLDLSANFLDQHVCYHLGVLLEGNEHLQELIISQCNLQSEDFRRIVVNIWRRKYLDILDVSNNFIKDDGFYFLMEQLDKGATVNKLNVSHNRLTSLSAVELTEALKTRSAFTHLNISWNNFTTLDNLEIDRLLSTLALSTELVDLNLSHNNLSNTKVLEQLLCAPKLCTLDLQSNQFRTPAVRFIVRGIKSAKSLQTLKLSCNPLVPDDALRILKAFGSENTLVLNLEMDHIDVETEFLEELEVLRSQRPKATITYGRLVNDYVVSKVHMGEIVLKRLNYLTTKPGKKATIDFCVYILTLHQNGQKAINPKMILRHYKLAGIKYVDEDVLEELSNAFPEGVRKKENNVDIAAVCDYIKRLYPDKEATPPPPPSIVEEPVKKKKGKKATKPKVKIMAPKKTRDIKIKPK